MQLQSEIYEGTKDRTAIAPGGRLRTLGTPAAGLDHQAALCDVVRLWRRHLRGPPAIVLLTTVVACM